MKEYEEREQALIQLQNYWGQNKHKTTSSLSECPIQEEEESEQHDQPFQASMLNECDGGAMNVDQLETRKVSVDSLESFMVKASVLASGSYS